MLIRCPTCASQYDLPSRLLPHGRILRCAHCRDAWLHDAAAPPIVAEARASRTAAPPPSAPPPALRPRRAPRAGGSLAAAALLFATLAGGMATVGQRERIVAALPATAAAFAALGLPVNLRGLALADVRSRLAADEGAPTLTLEGSIVNLRPRDTPVPAIRVAVRGADGRELYTWAAQAPKAVLAAGETVPFQARLSAPPRDGETVSVSFTDARPAPRHVAAASLASR